MPKYTFDYRDEFTISVEAESEKQAKNMVLHQDKKCTIEFGAFLIWSCFLKLIETEEQNDYRKE